jgi:hypothetical protein
MPWPDNWGTWGSAGAAGAGAAAPGDLGGHFEVPRETAITRTGAANTHPVSALPSPRTARSSCPRGRTGQCWDNALAESFFGSIKGELIDLQPWPTRAAPDLLSSSTSAGTTAPGCTAAWDISAQPSSKPAHNTIKNVA